MENHKNYPDELFEKARREEPVFSAADARSLLQSAASAGFSETYGNVKPKGKLITMGIVSASIISVVVGVLTLNIFNGTPDENISTIPVRNNTVKHNEDSFTPLTPVGTLRNLFASMDSEKSPAVQQEQNNDNKNTPAISENDKKDNDHKDTKLSREFLNSVNTEASNVKGVNVISLDNNELKSLGIDVRNDGSFSFTAFRDSKRPLRVLIDSDGIQTNFDGKLPERNDYNKITPRFVTNQTGTRRLSLINTEDGENLYSLTAIGSTAQVYDVDSLNKVLKKDFHFNLDSIIKCAKQRSDSLRNAMNINIDSMKNNCFIDKDSLKKSQKFKFDTSFFKNYDSNCKMHLDSKFDSLQLNIGCKKFKIKINEGNNGKDPKKIKEIVTYINAMMKRDYEDLKKINTYVAVGISNSSDNDHGFDYILWFDPDAEFIKLIPKRIREKLMPEIKAYEGNDLCDNPAIAGEDTYFDIWRACSGVIQHMRVFPNPVHDNLNLSFELTDSRKVTIALHDLSGRKLTEFITMQPMGSGSFNESLHLKNIEPGMYLVSIQTNKGEQAVQRVIVE